MEVRLRAGNIIHSDAGLAPWLNPTASTDPTGVPSKGARQDPFNPSSQDKVPSILPHSYPNTQENLTCTRGNIVRPFLKEEPSHSEDPFFQHAETFTGSLRIMLLTLSEPRQKHRAANNPCLRKLAASLHKTGEEAREGEGQRGEKLLAQGPGAELKTDPRCPDPHPGPLKKPQIFN